MSLATRKPQLKQMQVTPLLTRRGTLTHVEVRSTSGKLYHVAMPEHPKQALNCEQYQPTCHCKSDVTQLPVCLGNSKHTVCKHCLSALQLRFKMQGFELAIIEDVDKHGQKLSKSQQYQNAKLTARLGGTLVCVKGQGTGVVWAVARRIH